MFSERKPETLRDDCLKRMCPGSKCWVWWLKGQALETTVAQMSPGGNVGFGLVEQLVLNVVASRNLARELLSVAIRLSLITSPPYAGRCALRLNPGLISIL